MLLATLDVIADIDKRVHAARDELLSRLHATRASGDPKLIAAMEERARADHVSDELGWLDRVAERHGLTR
jgi:hypothetical protein